MGTELLDRFVNQVLAAVCTAFLVVVAIRPFSSTLVSGSTHGTKSRPRPRLPPLAVRLWISAATLAGVVEAVTPPVAPLSAKLTNASPPSWPTRAVHPTITTPLSRMLFMLEPGRNHGSSTSWATWSAGTPEHPTPNVMNADRAMVVNRSSNEMSA